MSLGAGEGGGGRDPKRMARREGEIPRDLAPGRARSRGGEIPGKIFETSIEPILTYGSEVWGVFLKLDFEKWDKTSTEKAH